MTRARVKILDVLIDVLDIDKAVRQLEEWVVQRHKAYVCVAPVATVVDALDDFEYRQVVNHADLVTPDGMPIVWVARMMGQKAMRRVAGPDLMWRICTDPCLAHLTHFFYGADQDTLQSLEKRLRLKNHDIKIQGMYAPPFRDEAQEEDRDIIERINRSAPDILWVGIGSPKQDYWMRLHQDELNVPVMIGVGAALDFLSGIKQRAPKWMQRCGLEWLFRLCCEPGRLWRRYVVGNARFCFELVKQAFGLRKA